MYFILQWNVFYITVECILYYSGMYFILQWNVFYITVECILYYSGMYFILQWNVFYITVECILYYSEMYFILQWNVDYSNIIPPKHWLYEPLTWPDRSRDAYDRRRAQAQAVLAAPHAVPILN